jgi:hypothetical protein
MLRTGEVARVVAFAPNTAIQSQWESQGRAFGLEVGTDRVLDEAMSALTYQSLAVFDADAEATDAERGRRNPLGRLHENGRALVEELRRAGRILLILDECHHLLEVWGRLLGEILEELPEARVLGLTATPPTLMSAEQSMLRTQLFGEVAFAASIPAVVREGDLAPFQELAWVVLPTPRERDWLDESAQRFTELTTALLDPKHGTTAFLPWLDERFLASSHAFERILAREPELADAALRFHYAGLLGLPPGGHLAEQHRQGPTADDWVLLLNKWILECVQPSTAAHDKALVQAVRDVLPAIGFTWTKRGIRRGRTPVDRVLARSAAKVTAAVSIVDAEQVILGPRLRMLVLCDYERASATLPATLAGVLEQQTGSAYDVLVALSRDASTAAIPALMVTAKVVAGLPETLTRLRAHVAESDPLAATLQITQPDQDGIARLEGSWTSRVWVRHVTAFFEAGGAQVLVGTRALLGEGWDARTVNSLIDLTTVTSSTSVVQTRGRALRTDPGDPEKASNNWTVTCVAPDHPRGDRDWHRLVDKHQGYFSLDGDGDIVDGVAHLDSSFSPYRPPASDRFDAVNAAAVARAQDRLVVREGWRVGEPYRDQTSSTLRVTSPTLDPDSIIGRTTMPFAVLGPKGRVVAPSAGSQSSWSPALPRRESSRLTLHQHVTAAVASVPAGIGGGMAAVEMSASNGVVTGATVGVAFAGWLAARLALPRISSYFERRKARRRGRRIIAEIGTEPPGLFRLAAVVADGMRRRGQLSRGAEALDLHADQSGGVRCVLRDVSAHESELFAKNLDTVLGPVSSAWGLRGVQVVARSDLTTAEVEAAGFGQIAAHRTFWYASEGLKVSPEYDAAWSEWVGGLERISTRSARGQQALAEAAKTDRDDLVVVLRQHWS